MLLLPVAYASTHEVSFTGVGMIEDTTLTEGEVDPLEGSEVLEVKANIGADLSHTLLKAPRLIGGSTAQVPKNATLTQAWLTLRSDGDLSSLPELKAWAVKDPWVVGEATWTDASAGVEWSGEGAAKSSTGHACGGITAGSATDFVVDMAPCLSPYLADTSLQGWALGFEDGDKAKLVLSATETLTEGAFLWVEFNASDGDADGWWEGDDVGYDCNDKSSAVNPAAEEVEGNGIDDDCDPATVDPSIVEDTGGDTAPDDGLATDLDGDRYASDLDCDDGAGDVYPGHAEWCDGVDNNCDGRVDEDCVASTEPGCSCAATPAPSMLGLLTALAWGTARARRRR